MNNTIFNSYLTGEERAEAIEESKYDLIFSRADMLFEMADLRLAQNIKEAEFKVFSENGTYDDYQYYIEEAEAEATQKKRGIIGTIIDAIVKILNKIGEKLAALGKKGNDEDEIEIDEGVIKTNNALANINGKVNGAIDSLKNGKVVTAMKDFFSGNGGIVAALAATAGVGVTTGVIVKKKRGDLKRISSFAESIKTNVLNAVNTVKSHFTNNENKTQDEQNNENETKNILTRLKDTVIKCVDFITTQLSKAWGGVKNAASTVADKVTGKTWVKANQGDEGALLVVADDGENFDSATQVKLSTVSKTLPDATADGNYYVKKEKKNAEEGTGDTQNSEQPANNAGEQTNNQNSDNGQNTTQQDHIKAHTLQDKGKQGDIIFVDKDYDPNIGGRAVYVVQNGKLNAITPANDKLHGKVGADNKIFDTARASNHAPNQGDKVIMASADDVVYDDDVNPFVEDANTSYDKYDLELSEIADMFRSL